MSNVNWFMLAAGGLYTGAAVLEFARHRPLMAGVYVCYAVSGWLLAFIKGQ